MNGLARAKLINSRLVDIYAQNNIPYLDTVPRRIQIIPTERCNYRCVMCFQSEESHLRSEELDFSVYEKLQDIFPFVQSVYFTGGEPIMYSDMVRALEYLSQYCISLSMSTNGSVLSGKRLENVFKYMERIKISIDAATSETYAKIRRNGDLNKVIHNILNLHKMKISHGRDRPIINFSMVAMKSNISELPDLVRLVKTMGSHQLRVAHASMHSTQVEMPNESLYFHKEESDFYMMESGKIANDLGVQLILPKLFNNNEKILQNNKVINYETGVCIEPWEYLLIKQNGKTAMCCSNCVGSGDLKSQSFDEVWNGKFVQNLRRQLNTKCEPQSCINCLKYKRNPSNSPELTKSQ